MKKLYALILLGGIILPSTSGATDLKQSKFTQVVNSVQVIASGNVPRPAAVDDVFQMPDVLRTGPESRAELVADDNTITRVGANTIFSFDPANRTIDLQQGSLLFHAPHGKGGGTIRTGSATASVIGTTIIVTTTPNGGFKVLDLEGQAEIRFLNGLKEKLSPGQMTFILPGGGTSPIIVFRLDSETKGSLLVNGFNNPLPSWPEISAEITRQLTALLNSQVVDVNLLVGDNATPDTVQVVMNVRGENQSISDSSIISSDHTANQPLPKNYSPLDSAHVQNGAFTPPADFSEGLLFLGLINGPSSGFTGNNIDIDTGGVPIDLSAFAGKPDFDIMAKGPIRIWQTVYFAGEEPTVPVGGSLPDTVALFAGGKMEIAPDSTVEADTGTLGLVAGSFATLNPDDGSILADNTLESVSIINENGDVDILSAADLTIESGSYIYAGSADSVNGDVDIESSGGSLTLGSTEDIGRLDDGHDVLVEADGAVYLAGENNLTLNDAEVDANGGNINLNAYTGDITLENGSYMDADSDIQVDAGGNIHVSDSDVEAGGSIYLDAGGNICLSENEDDNGFYAYNGCIDVCAEGYIYATDTDIDAYGSVKLKAQGDVTLDGDQIYAGDEELLAGSDDSDAETSNIKVASYNGNVTIDGGSYLESYNGGAEIKAGGDIDISCDSIIKADDGDVCITSYGDVETISDDSDSSTTGGNITIDSSRIKASDEIDITAENGNVTIEDASCLRACDGDINVTADNGYIDVEYSSLQADDSVNLTADCYVEVRNTDLCLNDWNITSNDSYVSLDADDGIHISDSDIYAGCDVDITSGEESLAGISDESESGSGCISICDSYIEANDDVNVTANGGGIRITGDSTLIADNGNVSITANGGGIKIGNSIISANGDICVTADDSINICDSVLSATSISTESTTSLSGSDDTIHISSGGQLEITGQNGDNDFGYDIGADHKISLWAECGISISDAIIQTLDCSDDCAEIKIDSDGNICIDDSTLDSNGSVKIVASDDSDIHISNTDITTAYGDVTIGSVCNTGDVSLSCSDIYAGADANVQASGDISIRNTDIYADTSENGGDVNISAGKSISIHGGNATGDSISVTSGSGDGGVFVLSNHAPHLGENASPLSVVDGPIIAPADVSDSDIDISDDVVTGSYEAASGWSIYLTDSNPQSISSASLIADGGNVNVNDSSDVTIDDSTISASLDSSSANGNVSITSGGILTIGTTDDLSSSITAAGTVSLTSVGDTDISDTSITADGSDDCVGVSISAGGNVSLVDSSIYSQAGDVDISANDGMLYINSDNSLDGGCADIYSGGSLELSGDCVEIMQTELYSENKLDITSTDGDLNLNNDDIETGCGDIDFNAYSGSLTLGSYVEAGGSVSLYADNDVSVSGSTIYADNGDIQITSEGSIVTAGVGSVTASVDICDSYLEASGNVGITANGDISLSGNDSCDDYGIYADNGDISIQSYSGGVNICDSSLNASQDVSIEGNGDVVVEDGSTITAGGIASLISDNGNVTVSCSEIDAGSGNDIHISDWTGTATGGCLSITANGNGIYISGADVTLANNTFNLGGDICVSGSDLSANCGDVNIETTGGSISVNASDSLNAYCNTITGGNIDLSCDTITATYGNVNIENNDSANDVGSNDSNIDISDSTISATASGTEVLGIGSTGEINISTPGNVDIEDSGVTADNGVNICAGGEVDLYDVDTVAESSDTHISGWTINAGSDVEIGADNNVSINCSDITAYCGDVDVCAGENASIRGGEISGNRVSVDAGQSIVIRNGDITGNSISINSGNSGVGPKISQYSAGHGSPLSVNDLSIVAPADVSDADVYISDQDIVDSTYEASVGGSIYVTDGNAQSISSSSLTADGGNANINDSSDVTIDDSTISASQDDSVDGNVSITSGGILTIGTTDDSSSTITAAGSINLQSVGDMDISSTTLNGNGVDDCGNSLVFNSTGGNIDIEDSTLNADGNISGSAFGYINIAGADGSVSGSVTLNAGDYINVCGPELFLCDWNLSAGSYVNLNSDFVGLFDSDISACGSDYCGVGVNIFAEGEVLVSDSDIYANNGDIQITSEGSVIDTLSGSEASVDICDSYLNASRDVSVEGEGDVVVENGSTISAGGIVSLVSDEGNVMVTCSEIDAGSGDINISGSQINATSGCLSITANGNGIYLSGETVTLINDTLNMGGNICVSGSDLSATCGDVDIETSGCLFIDAEDSCAFGNTITGGNIDLSCDTITATGGNVNIENNDSAFGIDGSNDSDINISDSTITATASGTEITDIDSTGEIHISTPGNVDITSSGLSADNGVTVCAGGYVDLNDVSTVSESSDTCISSWDITAGSDIEIGADNDVSIYCSDVTAYCGDVDINGGEENSISVSAGDSEENDVNGTGGNVKIASESTIASMNDDVSIYGGDGIDINASEDTTLSYSGNGTGGNVLIYNSSISAGGSVNISGGDGIYGQTSDDGYIINDGTGVGGNVQIIGSDICADGSVIISGGNGLDLCDADYENDGSGTGGSVFICDSTVTAGCEVTINAGGDYTGSFDGDVSITDGSTIQAGGDVRINMIGSSSFSTSSSADVCISDSLVEAGYDSDFGGSVYANAGGNIDISDNSTISAYDNVNITSGNAIELSDISSVATGDVSISDSQIAAGWDSDVASADGGNVNITANGGNICLSDDTIYAYEGDSLQGGIDDSSCVGEINLNAGGNIDVLDSTLSADNYVTLNAGGYVNAFNSSDLDICAWDVTAGTYVSLTADGNLEIDSSSITAEGGDIDITAGTIDLATISTSEGGITISDCTSIEASGSVNVNAYNGDITINNDSSLTADTGNITINAFGNVDIENSTISATGANSDIDVSGNDTESSFDYEASGGSISIRAGGDVTLNNDIFNLGGNINISGANLTASAGDFDATADWNITGTLTPANLVGSIFNGSSINIAGSTITATRGNINLTAGEDVNVEDSSLTASAVGKSVDISSGMGQVNISSSDSVVDTGIVADTVEISAQTGVTISGADIGKATSTDVSINNASGQTTINDGSTIQTAYLSVNSSDGILIDGTSGGSISAGTVTMTSGMGDASGGPTATIQNENLATVGTMNVSAHTVNLDNDNFASGSSYNFTSFDHSYYVNNTSDPHAAGYVNFNNDTLENTAIVNTGTAGAANQSNNGGIVLGGSGAGIHIN